MLDNMFSSVNTLQKDLGASWLKNEVISNNIANVDTPGFKASHVRFEDLMAEAVSANDGTLPLTVTNERHIALPSAGGSIENVEPEILTDETTSTRLDGNNVNIDNEMVDLAKNSIDYYTTVSKINSEFRKLNSAINVT
ncbi:flagellar basal-body rod protein FlgB [Sporobacter termitidis DSM 10068]|uniref:Flagellar basal body rod protein FlgB n=1 Tax=Sporobacter termitidis DSM 10068 TaxID=1123282 RepID=A0A1M5W7R9_9FIRM|nr:flagellar basal body rod protein FlgB [Sporobacter termitidis]SHH83562.1 flagellar basal-body rod protein FlgB [Sporobacter termitidis DSM 10068]